MGKSSMVQRFMEDTFTPEFRVTEGAYGKQKDIQLTQGPAKLQVSLHASPSRWFAESACFPPCTGCVPSSTGIVLCRCAISRRQN